MGGFIGKTVGKVTGRKMSTGQALFDPLDLLGTGAADAAERAAQLQARAGQQAIKRQEQAAKIGDRFSREGLRHSLRSIKKTAAEQQGFFKPFSQLGQQGLDQAGFLTDPQAQFDFLQNNPLFQLALDNANSRTDTQAAAGGRRLAGDTFEELSGNVLLASTPLIDRQTQNITNLLGFGTDIAAQQAAIEGSRGRNRENTITSTARSRANIQQGLGADVSGLLTDIGAARAGGRVGAANARSQASTGLVNAAATFFGKSDERLKKDKKIVGQHKGHTVWFWNWNEKAKELFNLSGPSIGVMAQTVKLTHPNAVRSDKDGYLEVNYGAL